jgi:antitoxin MazE
MLQCIIGLGKGRFRSQSKKSANRGVAQAFGKGRVPPLAAFALTDHPLDIFARRVYPRETAMQVAKWGNSLALRIPAAVAEALELREGDDVEIHVAGARSFGLARTPTRDDLLKRLRALRGRLPADFIFDRDEANAR